MKTLTIIATTVLVLGVSGIIWLRQRQKEQLGREQTSALQSQVQSLEESPLGTSFHAASPLVFSPASSAQRTPGALGASLGTRRRP